MQTTDEIKEAMIALLPRLRSFARALTRDHSRADDLVQQTCEKALRGLDQFTPGTRLDAWLFRIMRNAWTDDRRAPRHLELAAGLDEAQLITETGPDAVMARLELRAVERAMAALDPPQREVLMLVSVGGMTYRDAAEALDLPIGTVMSRLARARRALMAMIRPGTLPQTAERSL